MARGQSAAALKKLRRKYKLGEFKQTKGKKRLLPRKLPKRPPNPRPPGGIKTEADKLRFFDYYRIPRLPGD